MATHINLGLKGLLHVLPLDLLRCGHQPTFRRPFVGTKDHSLNNFDALEAVLLSDGLQVLQHKSLDRR